MTMRLPPLPRLRPKAVVPLVFVLLIGLGGFFVYAKSDASAAIRAASLLPYPAALVGARVILAEQILKEARMVQTFSGKTGQAVPESKELRGEILDQKIESALARNELARHNLFVSPALVDGQYLKLAGEHGGTQQIEKILRDLYGIGPGQFKEMIADRLSIDLVREKLLVAVFVRHILVAEEGVANDVVRELREGKDFGEAAKTYSKDAASKDNGGELGWLYRGQLPAPVEEVAFSANVGGVSNPVQTDLGWEIVLISDRRGSIDASYEQWLSDEKKATKTIILLRR